MGLNRREFARVIYFLDPAFEILKKGGYFATKHLLQSFGFDSNKSKIQATKTRYFVCSVKGCEGDIVSL